MESREEAAGKIREAAGNRRERPVLLPGPARGREEGQPRKQEPGWRLEEMPEPGANVLRSDLAGLLMLIKGRKQRGSHVL